MNTPFYIALRYLIAKKGSQAVSFITGLAAVAMMVAVSSMFIIISIFSGLEDMNKELMANLHPDITIKAKGKLLPNPKNITSILKTEERIKSFSNVIEEKVYVSYSGNGEIAHLRGVDSLYTEVNPINKSVIYGTYLSFDYKDEVIMEGFLNNRLAIPVSEKAHADPAAIFVPKSGEGLINKEEDIFNKKDIYVVGIFSQNEQFNNYIFSPIEFAREILQLPDDAVYQIVIKLKNPNEADAVKRSLLEKLEKEDIIINTQLEENEAFWKMINTEKLIIYLIFILVIFITTFNLAGAIIILQLDKKQQAKSLISLGFTFSQLRKTYFYTGALIVCLGVFFGLILGTLVCILQIQTGFFKASVGLDLPFPVKITLYNYLIVISSAFFFGLMVSWIFSKVNRHHLSSN